MLILHIKARGSHWAKICLWNMEVKFVFKFHLWMVIFIFAGHLGSLMFFAIANKKLTTFQGSRHESKRGARKQTCSMVNQVAGHAMVSLNRHEVVCSL